LSRLATVNEVVNTMTGANFKYGELDCCLFAALVAEKLTGKNYAEEFSYDSEEEAYQIIEEKGGLAGLLTYLLAGGTNRWCLVHKGAYR